MKCLTEDEKWKGQCKLRSTLYFPTHLTQDAFFLALAINPSGQAFAPSMVANPRKAPTRLYTTYMRRYNSRRSPIQVLTHQMLLNFPQLCHQHFTTHPLEKDKKLVGTNSPYLVYSNGFIVQPSAKLPLHVIGKAVAAL